MEPNSTTKAAMPLVYPSSLLNLRRADPEIVKYETLFYQNGRYLGGSRRAPMLFCETPLPEQVLLQLTQWFIYQNGRYLGGSRRASMHSL